jgi:hypothetical protein
MWPARSIGRARECDALHADAVKPGQRTASALMQEPMAARRLQRGDSDAVAQHAVDE